MRRILEYKIFDILKDKDNEEFLDKVKKENPDLYSRFLSIIGNKGLEIAKKKYKKFEPNQILKRKKAEKRIQRKEIKDISNKEILDTLKEEIDQINEHLSKSPLKGSILIFCQKDTNISRLLKKFGAKKKYTNSFKKNLKNPKKLKKQINIAIEIDKLNFDIDEYMNDITHMDDEFFGGVKRKRSLISITQRRLWDNSLVYSIGFGFYDIKEDRKRDPNFYEMRNRDINRGFRSNISYVELFQVLKALSYTLSDEYYDEWKLEQDAKKYNL